MKKRSTPVTLAVLTIWILAGANARAGDTPDAAKILEKADKAGFAKSGHMIMEQTIKTTGGDTRTFKMESWAKNGGEKSLMKYLSPAPSAGIGVLMLDHGDNIWAYFPDSDDLRKIASSARNSSVQGSDFSYEDMAMGETSRRWKAVSVTEQEYDGKPCYKLEIQPKKKSPYSKAVSWIDKNSYITYESKFFNKKGKHVKTLKMSGWKKIKGVWTPMKMVMKNEKKKSKTIIKIKKVKLNIDIEDSKFTTEFLTLV